MRAPVPVQATVPEHPAFVFVAVQPKLLAVIVQSLVVNQKDPSLQE